MARAFIAVASNIAPERNVRKGLRRLAQRVKVTALSTFYRSQPLGRPGQPAFVNGVAEIESSLRPRELKYRALRLLEAELGRVRTADKYAPRTLDLDLLVYEDWVISSPELTVPDPHIVSRPFLAIPLGELAPELALPGDGRTLREIAADLADHTMEPLKEYTEQLREDLRDGP